MTLTLLPDLGDLWRLHPQFNAGTLVEVLRWLGEREVQWASGPDPDHPLRDALPAARVVVRDLALPELSAGTEAAAEAEHAQLQTFLQQYPQGRDRLREAGRAEQAFAALLTTPLTPQRALGAEVGQAAQAYHTAVRDALGEGPGTRWRERRLAALVPALAGQTGAALVPLDDLPELLARLPGARSPDLTGFQPGETSRLRALADRAWQLREDDDLGALLEALGRESGDAVTPRAELDAAAAGIYLAVGDLGRARNLLERAAHGLTDELPRSLPGLVLARLGQVRDAQGDRELAQRTYRAVLALGYVPAVARGAAEAGLREAFRLEGV